MSATSGMEVADRILKSKVLFTVWVKVKSLKGFKQSADHRLSVLHAGNNIRDTVWRTVLAVSVIANPEIRFLIGVIVLIILSDRLYQSIGFCISHFSREVEILPCLCVLRELKQPYISVAVFFSMDVPAVSFGTFGYLVDYILYIHILTV